MSTPVYRSREEMAQHMQATERNFAVLCLTQWGLSQTYAGIVAERILQEGVALDAGDAGWLDLFRKAQASYARMADPEVP